ncbi:hypothetical protein [Streptomyces roseoverticillatus]|uniref:Uncharacterized protein n=1 Tax=Streptomyces roseoverticillatus TaxID=66429 RepID=A0ABV3J0W0_9ACTN
MESSIAQPFNRRVLLLTEVIDDPVEMAAAKDLAAAEGWIVHEPTEDEAARVEPRRRALKIEVRLRGARHGAVKEAVRRVERLAERARLGLWVRDSVLLTPPRESRIPYWVRLAQPTEGTRTAQRVLRVARRLDGSHDQRVLSLPGPQRFDVAVDELSASRLGGHVFDPAVEVVRRPPASAGDGTVPSLDPSHPNDFLKLCLQTALFLGSMLGCLLGGGAIYSLESPWRWSALPLALALAVPLGILAMPAAWPWCGKAAVGLGFVLFMLYMGCCLAATAPDGFGGFLYLPLPLLGGVLVAAAFYGLWLALRASWFSRNLSWIIPALLAPLYFVLPWFGKLLYTFYLTIGFDIPVDAVPVTTYSFMYAALKPVGLAAAFALLFLSVAGWARHFYWVGSAAGGIPALTLPAVAVVYVATALSYGILTVGSTWSEAADAVQKGRAPASFYGLKGKLMCVRPHEKDIAAYGGPVPTDQAVLTFGSTGDRVWLWGHQASGSGEARWASMSVRLEDVILTPAPSGGNCKRP